MSLLREAEKCLANQKAHAALNAFITPLRSSGPWLDRVRDADRRGEQRQSQSVVDGRLVSIKDNICTRDLPTTCASGILDQFTSPFNATVVDQLEDAGAVVAGKTNLDEFGMGSHSVHSRFGPVSSPRRDGEAALSAGGSSGGSAVAVATEQCYAALGTDTGGSVRLPAAYTGTVGFKPSYGLISRWGVVAYANSLDTVGIMGRDTSRVRDVFSIVNRHDPRDPTNISPTSRRRIRAQLESSVLQYRLTSSPLRIGVPSEYNISELAPSVRHAWSRSLSFLQKQGHSIHPVSLPSTQQALPAYYILAPAEASSNLAKYDGVRYGTRAEDKPDSNTDGLYTSTRGEGFGAEVKRRILLGGFSLSADAIDNYFLQAQRIRRLVQRDFNAAFNARHPFLHSPSKLQARSNIDVLISPTAPTPPPRLATLLDDASGSSSPLDAYTNDVFTVPASLAGLPAVSVPVTTADDELAGIQVVGQYGDDDLVLRVGELLEGEKFV